MGKTSQARRYLRCPHDQPPTYACTLYVGVTTASQWPKEDTLRESWHEPSAWNTTGACLEVWPKVSTCMKCGSWDKKDWVMQAADWRMHACLTLHAHAYLQTHTHTHIHSRTHTYVCMYKLTHRQAYALWAILLVHTGVCSLHLPYHFSSGSSRTQQVAN